MKNLHKKKCVPCSGDTQSFSISEANKYLKEVDRWYVKTNDEKNLYLEKKINFKNFSESQNFVNKVGTIAELECHHPDINFGWGYVKIIIYTHSIKGLTVSDFVLAAKIDQI